MSLLSYKQNVNDNATYGRRILSDEPIWSKWLNYLKKVKTRATEVYWGWNPLIERVEMYKFNV